MGSNYKILNSLDLSRNDILNVSRIKGYEKSNLGRDLEITTTDTTSSGNTILRAGVGSSASGRVHILAGSNTTWTNGTVNDLVNLRGGLSRGVIINPDSSISLISDNSTITADAKNSIILRSSSDGASSPSNKTSIILTSTDNKVAIKDTLFTLESTDDTTIVTTDLTTITSDKFKVSSTSGKYTLDVNSTTKPASSINGVSTSYNSLLKIEAVDVAEKINAQKGVEIAGDLTVKNTSSSFSKNVIIESNQFHVKSKDILEEFQGNSGNNIHYKLESNSNTHKLTIDNLKVNTTVDLNNLSIEGSFNIANTGNEYTRISTPEFTTTATNSLTISAADTLTITADSTSSSIHADYAELDETLRVNGVNYTEENAPAVDIRGALTVGKDAFLQGALKFDTSNGLITNVNQSGQITIEETNVKVASTNTTITGSQIDIKSSDNLNLTALGNNANLVIKSASSDSATAGLSIIADSTTSSITTDVLTARGRQAFNGTIFTTSVSSSASISAPATSLVGSSSLSISGPSNSNLSITADTTSSNINVKTLNVSTSASIQALSVSTTSTLSGNVNVNGNINLTGNGLITSTATTKQIHIQANDIIDIRRSTSAGSSSNSILYADSAGTYINASHLNLTTDLNFSSGKVRLTTTLASITIPTTITTSASGAALSITNNNNSGKALIASGNVDIGGGNTTIKGTNVEITPASKTTIGTSSTTVEITGNNNLKITSNDSTRSSFIQANNVKVNTALNVSGYAIYYDATTNSIVFAQGNL